MRRLRIGLLLAACLAAGVVAAPRAEAGRTAARGVSWTAERAGAVYLVRSRVHGPARGTAACLTVRETASRRLVGAAHACVRARAGWRSLDVAYRVHGRGHRLSAAVAGEAVSVAGVTVSRTGSARPTATTAPPAQTSAAPATAPAAAQPSTLGGFTTPPAPPASPTTTAPTPTPAAAPAQHFSTLPPGSALPSDAECAARVRPAPETRPQNTVANHTVGGHVTLGDTFWTEWRDKLLSRVDGNFTGTTDEIIQWASCKWGFDEDVVRAVAVQESGWLQSAVGDNGQSFGLLQVKVTVHTAAAPYAAASTAFNVDYALAYRRACFEGYFSPAWLPAEAKGDEWDCVGLWFSGNWKDAGSNDYVAKVKAHLAARAWQSY